MIEWILRQLERQPSTLFYEKELREKSVSEFEELKARNCSPAFSRIACVSHMDMASRVH